MRLLGLLFKQMKLQIFLTMSNCLCPFAGLVRHMRHMRILLGLSSSMLTAAIKDVLIRCTSDTV